MILRLYRPELDDPLGARFGNVNRAILANRDIVHGIEDGIAGFPEADGCDDIKVAIQLEDAGVVGIVVGTADADVKEPVGIGIDTKDAAGCLSVLHAGPLPFKLADSIEELKT